MDAIGQQTRNPAQALAKGVILFLAMCVFLYIQFRVQINNGFTTLYGDSYDAAIVVAILEHWRNVFAGDSHWSQLYYFYPYQNTLAQTDGYFIIGVIYSVIRLFSTDPFVSSELSNVVVRAMGFLSFYWMLRRVFDIRFGWAVFAAGLFIIANNLTVHGTRVQLATLAFAPFVATLLYQAYQALLANEPKRLFAWGSGAGVALGAWALTCFYILWFYVFFTVALGLALLYVATKAQRLAFWHAVKRHKWTVLAVSIVAIVSMIPLLSVYLPKAAESGVRSYGSSQAYAVTLPGILQVGESNILFGELYNKLLKLVVPSYTWAGEYYNTGIAPIIFVLFCFAGWTIYQNRSRSPSGPLMWAIFLASVITWLCVIRVGKVSLWFFVYHLFPGAKALNVIGAYQIFLAFPIVVVVTVYLSKLMPRLPLSILLILGALLIGEEMNRSYIALDRQAELAKVDGLSEAPKGCEVFYVSGWPKQESQIEKIYAHNVSAMLIAELLRMPTINGFASFNPPDWNLADPNDGTYDQRVGVYSKKHDIQRLCKLDLATKQWQSVNP
ncbi:TPA: hypothetical protein ACOJNU_002047 [Pseudomonas putida]|nr:hypothetical protein [Pseudomonas putida]